MSSAARTTIDRRETPLPSAANQRGIALLAVMGIILALLPVAAAVTLETQLDVLMQRNARGSAIAFYAAEAGLAHARAELRPSASLTTLLNGPDATADTADDGRFPFRTAAPADFRSPTSRYDVFAIAASGSSVRLLSKGRGPYDAIREVEALIAAHPVPYTPGAVYVELPSADIDLGTAGFVISGTAAAGAGGVAALAVPSATAVADLRASLSPEAATGAGGSPSVVASAPLDLASFGDTLADRVDSLQVSPASGEPHTLGTRAAPQLTIVHGTWTATQPIDGCGILLVRGDLEVRDRMTYRGLAIVAGRIETTGTSDIQIEGALWTGGAALHLAGSGSVRYAADILVDVASAIPDALLHVPEVVAWREVS